MISTATSKTSTPFARAERRTLVGVHQPYPQRIPGTELLIPGINVTAAYEELCHVYPVIP